MIGDGPGDIERRHRAAIQAINDQYVRDVRRVKVFVGVIFALMAFSLIMAAFT